MGIHDTRSKATRSSARFGISDMEYDMWSCLIMVKKENDASSLPMKKADIDLIVKTLGSRKRKIVRPRI